MKRSRAYFLLSLLFCAAASLCQDKPADPYKATLDRLDSLTRQGETEWRFHADIPHPEDPTINDADWGTWTVKNVSGPGGQNANEEHWTGTRVFRRWVQIPEKIHGYSTAGSDPHWWQEKSTGGRTAPRKCFGQRP
jgi:hypothetical protein